MKKKNIFRWILLTLVMALVMPVAVLFAACNENPPEKVGVVFVVDGHKEQESEINKFSNLSVDKANELFDGSKVGYSLDGWYVDSAMTRRFTGISKVEGKTILYGRYVINTYSITYVLGGNLDNIVVNYEFGADVAEPNNPERLGYTFAGWSAEIP